VPAVSAHPGRVVFVDETSTKLRRNFGEDEPDAAARLVATRRTPRGGCTIRILGHADVHRRAHRQRHDRALDDYGAMDGPAFAAYVEKVLVPELEPGTVVILDNLATHKNAVAARAMRKAGCWFLFLPPYSPDLNPIEMAFSKLKAHLRRFAARTFTSLFDALAEICQLYSPEECWNYFTAARYASS